MDNLVYLLKSIKLTEKSYSEILHITSNENVLSKTAEKCLSSPLAQRYHMGYGENGIVVQGRSFAAKGMPEIQMLEEHCNHFVEEKLGGQCAYLHCLSGVHGMMCAILSLTEVGDTIMSVISTHGGHFCTRGVIENTGRKHIFAEYDFDNLSFDIEKTAKLFKEAKAKLFYIDTSVYLKPHLIRQLREALGPDALIVFDASHTLGLMLGNIFPSPLTEGADLICANTHKTLFGPQKGLMCFKNRELAEKSIKFIKSCLISSIHTGSFLALCVSLLEFERYGNQYVKQIVSNANALGTELEKLGFYSRKIGKNQYTQTHQLHTFVCTDRVETMKRLLRNNISTTVSRALGNELFIRLGLQEITRKGLKETDMSQLAYFLSESLKGHNVSREVASYAKKLNKVYYSFDGEI